MLCCYTTQWRVRLRTPKDPLLTIGGGKQGAHASQLHDVHIKHVECMIHGNCPFLDCLFLVFVAGHFRIFERCLLHELCEVLVFRLGYGLGLSRIEIRNMMVYGADIVDVPSS